MNRDAHRQLVQNYEGGLLQTMATANDSDFGRAAVNGIINALVRRDGAEETAKFLFAVTDRVTSDLPRGEIFLPPPKALPAAAEPPPVAPIVASMLPQASAPETYWRAVLWLFAGIAVGLLIAGPR